MSDHKKLISVLVTLVSSVIAMAQTGGSDSVCQSVRGNRRPDPQRCQSALRDELETFAQACSFGGCGRSFAFGSGHDDEIRTTLKSGAQCLQNTHYPR